MGSSFVEKKSGLGKQTLYSILGVAFFISSFCVVWEFYTTFEVKGKIIKNRIPRKILH